MRGDIGGLHVADGEIVAADVVEEGGEIAAVGIEGVGRRAPLRSEHVEERRHLGARFRCH